MPNTFDFKTRKTHKIRNLISVSFLFLLTIAQAQEKTFFESTDAFLKAYVVEGGVNYTLLFENRTSFDSLINDIEKMNLEGKTDSFKKAFYINSYNLLVIKGVLDQYPVSSPLDIEGFFKELEFTVAQEQTTLDDLEFGILFNQFRDLRLHFILNCGAKSCPTLFSKAINELEVEDQLKFSTAMVMNRDDFVKIDHENKQVVVSKIFDWYKDMFEKDGATIRRFVNSNRFESLPITYDIVFDEYDWSLNEF